ncbi:MAG: threonine-phosphate decarboxylase CobD [Gorillibacterium sp.]|nr:threonine-phosphate decarboxylase CobD [Gorillibacterium sp.]
MLEAYGHGGDILTAKELFGRTSFLDFSSNMNPFGPPPAVSRIISDYGSWITAYPDPAVRELRHRLACYHDIPEASILVGNGAAELIDLVIRLLKPARTALAEPAFVEYGDAVRKSGGAALPITLQAKDNFILDVEQLKQLEHLAASPDLWFLGHPNNPTGQLLSPEVITHLLQSSRPVILDEAFIDFLPQEGELSLLKQAAAGKDLFVIRSMTKFYAIPGIRLGYMVAHPDRIRALRELQVPWSVNSLAQQIGCAVLEDAPYAEQTLHWLTAERPWLISQLQALGLTVFPSDTNYLLVSLADDSHLTAPMLQQSMGRLGVLIRDASLFAGLDTSFFRLAIKFRAANEQLLAVLDECLKQEVVK